jgi:hypothetical protein
MMEESLRARLLDDAGLAAKVGDHVDWGLRPSRDTLNAITLTIASAAGDYHYTGRSRLQRTRVQIDVWGRTATEAILIKRMLPAIVEPPALIGDTRFDASFVTLDETGGPEEMAGGGIAHRHIMEFTVWHRPAV